MNFKHTFLLLGLLLPVLGTLGCTRHVSRGLTDAGDATELVFPDETRMVVKGGTAPPIERLRPLAAGMSKDQVRALVGSPHFREGYGAREWDYLFQLRAGDGGFKACRFKVLYDQGRIARNLYWAPAECAGLVAAEPAALAEGPTAASVPLAPAAVQGSPAQRFELSADALFGFGKSSREDLSPAGLQRLRRIAAGLVQAAGGISQVQVVGHADRIGSAAANQRLSARRAQTVREVLVEAGLPAASVQARGMGEQGSFTRCGEALPHAELVACLAPDRRVEIKALPAS